MYTVSSDWSAAVRSSGVRIHRAELYYGDVDTPIYGGLGIESFEVRADRRSSIRRTGTLTIVDETFYADLVSSTPAVEPYGSEIKVWAGVSLPDGSEESVPLGVFVVEELAWNDGDIAVNITMSDRSYLLEASHAVGEQPGYPLLTTPTTAQAFLTAIFSDAFPSFTLVIDSATENKDLQPDVGYEGSWLDIIHQLLELINADGYFDVDGVFQVKPYPFVPATLFPGEEDWKISSGDTGTLISASRTLSRRDTYNEIIVKANKPGLLPDAGGTVNGVLLYGLQDTDTNSLTYINGPFGVSSKNIEMQHLATAEEQYSYTAVVLDQAKSLSKTLTLTHVMNPALHEGDTILVVFEDGTEELHFVDSISYSSSWNSSVTTRVQRVS